jgi:hypothetical protein
MNLSTAQQLQRRSAGHYHSVLPEGNTSTTASGNGTGAVQSFASILAGVTGGK